MTFKFLAGISSLVLLFPLVISICRYKVLAAPLRVICIHVFVAALFELVSRWLWMHNQNNLFLLHLYTLWELEIISLFYLLLLKRYVSKRIIVVVMVAFALFSGIDAFYMDGWKQFNTYARPVECLIAMSYTIIYLYSRLTDLQPFSVNKDPVLLINIGFLFYFSLSFFLFLLSNYIMHDAAKTLTIWAMHTLVALIFYTTIGWALWKAGRK